MKMGLQLKWSCYKFIYKTLSKSNTEYLKLHLCYLQDKAYHPNSTLKHDFLNWKLHNWLLEVSKSNISNKDIHLFNLTEHLPIEL